MLSLRSIRQRKKSLGKKPKLLAGHDDLANQATPDMPTVLCRQAGSSDQ
jgi:hypothetical protein